MKARVDTVLSTLSTKRVKDEKVLEFKKQIVSNKSLKEYFKNNPNEKEILQNDIQKNSYKDKILFRNLGTLPSYAVPKEIMATTKDQIQFCTAGSGLYVPDWIIKSGAQVATASNKMLVNSIQTFVEPDEAQTSTLINNLLQFPLAAQRYAQSGASLDQDSSTLLAQEEADQKYAYEHPSILNHEQLEPTSGRKAWMIKHGKRIKKKLKADKRGFIGGAQ